METIEQSVDVTASRQSRRTGLVALGVFVIAGITVTLLPKVVSSEDSASIPATSVEVSASLPEG